MAWAGAGVPWRGRLGLASWGLGPQAPGRARPPPDSTGGELTARPAEADALAPATI
ncbi:hypothetical protein [Streptomyces lavenduligriseus]|uniref:Uncharacterized protein n=1 Tax=Streptomyces lavenduligriseus TaxID=67315 RepID=A0ABT0NM27_9ACTN|nr:hypothetical protein [Streptomyces lavenduligriseus]MCL3992509.1 hypothetical protein [Streptomyces lavenduligriseus]